MSKCYIIMMMMCVCMYMKLKPKKHACFLGGLRGLSSRQQGCTCEKHNDGEGTSLTWNTSFMFTISAFVDNSMQHSF